MTRCRWLLLAALLIGPAAGCGDASPEADSSRSGSPSRTDKPDTAVPDAGPTSQPDGGASSPAPVLGAAPVRAGLARDELRGAIDRAAAYLVRACGEDGKFVYCVDLDPTVTPEPKYNMLRHAGAIYALGMAEQRRADAAIEAAMVRAAGFLQRRAIGPVPQQEGMRAVWSDPELTGTDGPLQAKLGGAGLGLVALLSVERARPGLISRDELRALGRFVVWMQKEDGGFYSKYLPEGSGRDDSWTSLYYPGEAALGLLMLDEHDPSPEWLEAAARAIAYLARMRRDRVRVEADHWALLATAKLLEAAEGRSAAVDREAALRHAAQVCEAILEAKPRYTPSRRTAGCLTADGRTCPTATRLEGLLAALTFLPPEKAALRARIEEAVHEGIAFLVRAQVQDGPHSGAMPRAPEPSGPDDRRATEVRIDYVQHALSAMIQYERTFYDDAERRGHLPSRRGASGPQGQSKIKYPNPSATGSIAAGVLQDWKPRPGTVRCKPTAQTLRARGNSPVS